MRENMILISMIGTMKKIANYFGNKEKHLMKLMTKIFLKINGIYSQINFDNLVYRFKDGRKRDFTFIGNAKIVLTKQKLVQQNLNMQKNYNFFVTNVNALRKGNKKPQKIK